MWRARERRPGSYEWKYTLTENARERKSKHMIGKKLAGIDLCASYTERPNYYKIPPGPVSVSLSQWSV